MYSLCSLDGGGLKTLLSWWRPGCWATNASMHHYAANCDCTHPPAELFCLENPGRCFILIEKLRFVREPLFFLCHHAFRFLRWCHVNWNALARRVFPIFHQTLQEFYKWRRFQANACQPQHCAWKTSGAKDAGLLVIISPVWGRPAVTALSRDWAFSIMPQNNNNPLSLLLEHPRGSHVLIPEFLEYLRSWRAPFFFSSQN